ncbi:MAG: 5'-methylthioadenosine/S-adenosylhomocysteine nucleosidase [Clostridiaceae bacterium]|nr:5'-methylthioadenosine/S-adenosylhomocysteine nucleosidase [Clostridiaceae bacterium]
MILIITALMVEAAPVIEHFKLKRDMSIYTFPVYRNSEIALIVSGVGKIKSAIAATYLISISNTKYSKDSTNEAKNHVLVNIGFCGASEAQYDIGSLLLINRVTDMDTGKDSYPDLFVGKDLPKENLYCFSRLINKEDLETIEFRYNSDYAESLAKKKNIFCDMESSGIIEVSKKFTYSHQVVILKMISDYLNPENLDKEILRVYLMRQMPKIEEVINELKQIEHFFNESFTDMICLEEEKKALDIIAVNLKFSQAMKQMLFKEIKKAKYKGMEPLRILGLYTQTNVDSKKEGKKILNEIAAKLNEKDRY